MGELPPMVLTAEPHPYPEGGSGSIPGQAYQSPAESQQPQLTGNVLEGTVTGIVDTPYAGPDAIMPAPPQPDLSQLGPFDPTPKVTEGLMPKVERTGDLAYRIVGPRVARLAIEAALTPVTGKEVAIPTPAAETERPHDKLRQTLMDRLRGLANDATLEGLGYDESVSLSDLEYAVNDAAHEKYHGSSTSVISLEGLKQKRAASDRFEQLGITDLSDEAVAQRALNEEKYLELNGQLYKTAMETYSDDELRAAGYDWASADELYAIVAAAKQGGKQPLPDLQAKRASQREQYAQMGYPTYEQYQKARIAIEQMYLRLVGGNEQEGRRIGPDGAWIAAQQAAEQARFAAAGAGSV